eukprot:CAMPEP_0113505152 /NCGR_PEP_ID=MMETSP0014_2-20120614/35146_1 /TAXON_ID=2857 /ORGANISM="Nitzschia sp." /LENGTH=869 /DNA_ID=CAMNT_0000400409 /DNA_START=382 /DNA_END=2991 /DNA_ORIENTATION=+ /assembly_acc=CAM_ASM_000159
MVTSTSNNAIMTARTAATMKQSSPKWAVAAAASSLMVVVLMASSTVTAAATATASAASEQQQQQQPIFRVRHRRNNNNNRGLQDLQQGQEQFDTMMNVIPTLSQDDGMIDAELPPLTLELIGTNGTQLSLPALFQIEFTMSDYLTELLQDRWPDTSSNNVDIDGSSNVDGIAYNNNGEVIKPVPALNRVRTIVVSDAPMYEDEDEDDTTAGGNGGNGGRGRGRHLEFTQSIHRLDRNHNRPRQQQQQQHRLQQHRHLRLLQQQQQRELQQAEDAAGTAMIGNTLQLVATLTFVDQSPPPAGDVETSSTTPETETETGNGTEGAEGDDNSLRQSAPADAEAAAAFFSLPDEESLEVAAGDAWNDMNFYFGNFLYPAVTINANDPAVQEEFLDLRGVESGSLYPTSAPVDVDVTTPTSPPDDEEEEEEEDPVEEPATATTAAPTEASGGSVTLTGSGGSDGDRGNTIASINDETYASQNSGDGGVDPLYPAIAAGVACFLCTIIVLGYRRQARHSELIGNKSDLNLDDGEEPPIHVHNSTFLDDGEEEIEVEDEHIKRERSMVGIQCGPSRRNRNDHDYDQFSSGDDYGSSSQRDSNYNFNYDYDLNGIGDDGANPGSRSMRDMYGGSSLVDDTQSEQSSAGYDGGNSRNNYVPQQYQQSASTRNSSEADELDIYASLSPEEKKIFLRYINQGYPVQQAKDMILSDRGQGPPRSRRQQPSSRSPEEKIQSELMPDGHTMIHIPSNLDGGGSSGGRGGGSRIIGHDGQIMLHGNSSNRRQQHGSRSMRVMMTETASSIGSNSFDDRDYLRNASSGSLNGPVADPIMEHGESSGGGTNNRFSFNRSSKSSSRQQQRPVRGQVADPNVMSLPDY